MAESVPRWKFWHPLPFWQLVVVAFLAQLLIVVPVAMLNGGLQLGIPMWIPSGIAGVAMWAVIFALARRRVAAERRLPTES